MNDKILGDINRIEQCLFNIGSYHRSINSNLDSLKKELSKQLEPLKIEVGDVKLRNGKKATVAVTNAKNASYPIQGYKLDDDNEVRRKRWSKNGKEYDSESEEDIIGKWED